MRAKNRCFQCAPRTGIFSSLQKCARLYPQITKRLHGTGHYVGAQICGLCGFQSVDLWSASRTSAEAGRMTFPGATPWPMLGALQDPRGRGEHIVREGATVMKSPRAQDSNRLERPKGEGLRSAGMKTRSEKTSRESGGGKQTQSDGVHGLSTTQATEKAAVLCVCLDTPACPVHAPFLCAGHTFHEPLIVWNSCRMSGPSRRGPLNSRFFFLIQHRPGGMLCAHRRCRRIRVISCGTINFPPFWVKEVGQMGTMARHNTQNRQKVAIITSMFHKTNTLPCSRITTQIARAAHVPCERTSGVPLLPRVRGLTPERVVQGPQATDTSRRSGWVWQTRFDTSISYLREPFAHGKPYPLPPPPFSALLHTVLLPLVIARWITCRPTV